MRRLLLLVATASLLVGILAVEVWARGPRGGPAMRGGVRTPGNGPAQFSPNGPAQFSPNLQPAGSGAKADRAIQLDVSQDGTIRGSHYDLISNDVDQIYGAVNKQTLQVTWKVGAAGIVVFKAPLDELTKDEGQVTVHHLNGSTDTWIIERVTK